MTVIAYSSKHRTMAADSRCSDKTGSMHLTNCQKVFTLRNGALLGSAGDADARELFELLKNVTPRKLPSRHALAELRAEIEALLVFPKGQTYLVTAEFVERGAGKHGAWDGEVLPLRDGLISIGSGAAYAYGAMGYGANPVESVRVACKFDLMCALPVQWERLP